MPKVVKVTPAQVNAAKLAVKRSAASGRFVPSSVQRIANAEKTPIPSGRSAGREGK